MSVHETGRVAANRECSGWFGVEVWLEAWAQLKGKVKQLMEGYSPLWNLQQNASGRISGDGGQSQNSAVGVQVMAEPPLNPGKVPQRPDTLDSI